MVKLDKISNAYFTILLSEIENDLSTAQKYAYRISVAIIKGSLEKDLRPFEIEPIFTLVDFGVCWLIYVQQKHIHLN